MATTFDKSPYQAARPATLPEPLNAPLASGLSHHARKAPRRIRRRPKLVLAFSAQAELFPLELYYSILHKSEFLRFSLALMLRSSPPGRPETDRPNSETIPSGVA